MFGTTIYGIVPYATEDSDEDELFNPWVEQCKSDDTWEKEVELPTEVRRCPDGT